MNKKQFTNEHMLYLIAFICALSMRLINLGNNPLSEFEASWALQALDVSQGNPVAITGQPAYVLLTGFMFAIFTSGDTLARLLPALMGSMVIWLPFALRSKLGKVSALIFAFGLAFDPGLVAGSRVAGGPMLAIGFGAMMVTAWLLKAYPIAGVLGGLFLMSGVSMTSGLVGLAGALIIWSLTSTNKIKIPAIPLRKAGFAGGLTIIFIGTLFMRHPQGLSAMMAAFPDYLNGWSSSGGASIGQMIGALLIYQPLAFIFGFTALIRKRTWNNQLTRLFGLWLIVALGLALLSPSQQVYDLGWVLLPLWGLAGFELVKQFRPIPNEMRPAILGQAILILIFILFFGMNFIRFNAKEVGTIIQYYQSTIIPYFEFPEQTVLDQNVLILFLQHFIVPILAIFSTLLVWLGWSAEEAIRGTVIGFLIFFGYYSFATSWSAGHIRERAANELWTPNPAVGQSKLLRDSLNDLSQMNTGNREDIEVVYLVDSSSLDWVLRDMPNARFANRLSPSEMPMVIISDQSKLTDPLLEFTYRGQSFNWNIHRSWLVLDPDGKSINSAFPYAFNKWLLFREGPTYSDQLYLWARNDLFPEGTLPESEELE